MAISARIDRYRRPVLVARLLACRLFTATAPGSQFGVTNENPQQARRAELAAFLRAQRARLRPADAGLPEDPQPGRRRTPGLRREEVAQIAGVSVTWYTWLEQGRDIAASQQVVDALAGALRLSPDQHRYLCGLAGLPVAAGEAPAADARPRLQRLVDAACPSIASIYDRHFDYVVWNTPYERVRGDPALLPATRRNLVWMMFSDAENRARMVGWEPAARAVLSQFRAAAASGRVIPVSRRWWPS